jgi:glycosyltransferase involved in cell wall biosynthesis
LHVHQFLPVLDKGDAIGNHAMALRNLLRRKGLQSDIYVWRAGKGMKGECLPYRKHRAVSSADHVAVLHFSIGSPLTAYVKGLPDKKVMVYHNVTPEKYFIGISEHVYYIARSGRKELASVGGSMDLCFCDSEFNRRDLMELGYGNIHVIPLLMEFSLLDVPPDTRVQDRYSDGWKNILFVGRIAPNKKQEDVIRVFYYYKKFINSDSRLFLIGTPRQTPRYQAILEDLVQRLGLDDVIFTGAVSQPELVAYYKVADAFVCMSEHEGFGVPLVEAMHFRVPIVALDAGAVPETLGGAGVLVRKKDHGAIAELIDLLLSDEELRSRILERQDERLRYFGNTDEMEGRLLKEIMALTNQEAGQATRKDSRWKR